VTTEYSENTSESSQGAAGIQRLGSTSKDHVNKLEIRSSNNGTLFRVNYLYSNFRVSLI